MPPNRNTRITERQHLEVRLESSNILNHPSWPVFDQNINSPAFGRIFSSFYNSRLIQFGLRYRF